MLQTHYSPQSTSRSTSSSLSWVLLGLVIVCMAGFCIIPYLILTAPNEPSMGFIQRIFYFHVPCAWVSMLAALICGIASAIYLFKRTPLIDQVAVSAAELVVVFGLCVLITGPLWAKKAWGVYWEWDVRLTTTLLLWLIFVIYLFCRKYAGPGAKKLAAGLAIFGVLDVPLIYVSVSLWRTIHPKTSVVPSLTLEMKIPFWASMMLFTILFAILLWVRIQLQSTKEAYLSLAISAQEQNRINEDLGEDFDE